MIFKSTETVTKVVEYETMRCDTLLEACVDGWNTVHLPGIGGGIVLYLSNRLDHVITNTPLESWSIYIINTEQGVKILKRIE